MGDNLSPVAQFYKKKTVFITGATGFMGKVLVEKLLRSTDLLKVFVLIRPKKNVQTEQRLERLLSSAIFDRIRSKDPLILKKVEAVDGDITEENLGIDEGNRRMLTRVVNVVFHCAATVRFDEELTKSVTMNVGAVAAIIKLARRMEKLEALVDVSTAYCNCDRSDIGEMIYPTPASPTGLLQCCKWMESEKLNSVEMTSMLIGDRPNTYTYTKALAEQLLLEESVGLPVVIIRPSIVTAAWREPFPGWVDNFNGATGVLAGGGSGILRSLYVKRSGVADMVPVDMCINLMCVLGWKAATQPPSSPPPVYNCTSGATNPVTWGEVEKLMLPIIYNYPFETMFWHPGGSSKENWYSHRFCQLLFHYGTAYLVDLVCWLAGRKPFLVKISNMIQKSTKVLEPFSSNSWNWSNSNMEKLQMEMTKEDKALFSFDLMTGFNWRDYLEKYVQGIRKFLFKSEESTIPQSRRRMRLLYWLDVIVKGCFLIAAFYLLSFILQ